MTLGRLGISHVRNIKNATIELGSGINLLVGANGSGKTSLLESVHFLGSGRTFRSHSLDPFISRGESDCTVFGSIESESSGTRRNLGVTRGRDGSREIRLNGEKVDRASSLARNLPMLVLGPGTVELLTGPPGGRRRFLNWGVFHVEPSFGELWESANRSLRQRNELLRRAGVGFAELRVWNEQLGALGVQIDAQRQAYFDQLQLIFSEVVAALAGMENVRLSYQRGWDRNSDIRAVLTDQTDADIQRGFTQSGFHRADVRLRVGTDNAASVCSRGELKVLAWALVLAQGQLFINRTGNNLIFLVDDLASELDGHHRQRVCSFLEQSTNQVLVTAIDRDDFRCWESRQMRVFHVEHGSFTIEGEDE